MANVIIQHPDGRRYEVSEESFQDLYAPVGFQIEGVMVGTELRPDSDEARATADILIADTTGKPHEQLIREHMARTDVQTNGATVEEAAEAHGVSVEAVRSTGHAQTEPGPMVQAEESGVKPATASPIVRNPNPEES